MLQFEQYLEEREIHHRSAKGGKAKDEETFGHFATYASETLGTQLDLTSLLTLVAQAKNDSNSPLSFKKAAKNLFVENTKNEESKQSYHNMLRQAAFSLAATAKHSEFKNLLKNGFRVEVAGREIYDVSPDWTRHGVPLRSITGTGKTDLRFIDNKTGKIAATASMKRGAGQGLSAQPGEAMAVLYYTANKTMKETLGDRAKHPKEFGEVFGILAEFDKTIRSTGNIKDKEKRDKAINRVKPKLQALFEDLQDRPYLGLAWRKSIIRESMMGEGKFLPGSPGIPSYVLGFGEDDAFFNTMDEYLKLSEEEIANTPIYFTLPKTREGKYPVFRTGTPKKIKKTEPGPEAPKKTRPASEEPHHPLEGAGAPGSPDMAFYGPHELTMRKPKVTAPTPTKAAKPRVISKMKAKVTGALKKKITKPEPTKPTRPKTPWDKIEPDYSQGRLTVDDISKKYNVNPATIKWHAGTHGWKRGVNI